MTDDESRKAFEEWARAEYLISERKGDRYFYSDTTAAFQGWKAAINFLESIASYELWQGSDRIACANSQEEIKKYAKQYGHDEPVEVYRVIRMIMAKWTK